MSKTSQAIFLDYASATPVSDEVITAVAPYSQDEFYNPSAIYLKSKNIKKVIDESRHKVAQILGAKSDEIIFTAGATESCNLAIHGLMKKHPGSKVLISNIEHSAVEKVAKKYDAKTVAVNKQGTLSREELAKSIDDETLLVSIIYANNEIGVIQNMSEISRVINNIRIDRKKRGIDLPVYLHSDGSQASNYLDSQVARLRVDMLTLNGGKMYGPKQTGILYVRSGVELEPIILGGGQESGLRSGTENVSGIVGFAKALEIAQASRKDESYRLSQLRDKLIRLLEDNIDNILVNGHKKRRLPNNINITLDGYDGERLVMMLDEAGYQVATGAACSALGDESSHVLRAIGRTESEARGSIRITLGRATTEDHIDGFAKALIEVISKGIV